ncbi:NPCBM/NEW2 domain-containing protein [Acetobacterium wieringae]|nr:NPCBM/NEW2 domain-containing protein [Acetobacterium wieringae]
MKRERKKKLTLVVFMVFLMVFGLFPFGVSANQMILNEEQSNLKNQKITYLENLTPINSDRYIGNEGDSFIDTIGRRNGNIDVQGNQYAHGLTAWVARWNYSSEVSWVWNEYDLKGQFEHLLGKIVLIKSRNESNFNTNIEIIGDGRVLYANDLTPENLPTVELNIDVRNVSKLTIKLHDNISVPGGTAFGLADFRLTGEPSDNNDSEKIYADSEIYIADAIINGFRDKDGKNNPLVGMQYNTLYEYAIFDKPLYREAAEYLIEDGLSLSTTVVWAGLFDHEELIKNPEYFYEIMLMDYLKYETGSSPYQSEIGKKAAENGKAIGNEIFDYMEKMNMDPDNFKNMSKADADKLMANTTVLSEYKGLYDECFAAATSAVDLLNTLSNGLACAKAKEERVAALELMKKNVGENPDLEQALDTVLSAIKETDLFMAGKTTEAITDVALKSAWETMTRNNPVIKGYELTGLGFDLLFGSTTKEQTNLKLLSLQIIDSEQYLALIEAKHNFDAAPTHENAVAFNGAYLAYTDFKLYGLDFISRFGENTVSDSLLGYLLKFASGEQRQLVKDFTDKANFQVDKIQSLQAILSNYHDNYVEIYQSSNSVYDDIPEIAYSTHVQNLGWQDWKYDGEMSGTEGRKLRLEGIRIKTGIEDVGIKYRTHVQNLGWQDWCSNGEISGTEGLSYRLEAIQIELTGNNSDLYDVYYRVHTQNIGWMGWAKNGELSGSEGFGYRLEGIKIRLVNKGAPAPGSTENAFVK